MITIMPTKEIMKAVLDKKISSEGAIRRRKAFDEATLLLLKANLKILITSTLWEMDIKPRLSQDHITVFKTLYDFDNSTKGLSEYDITGSINWVAKSEMKSRKTVIITENPQDYPIKNENIVIYTSEQFLEKLKYAQNLYARKVFSLLDDAIIAVFFFKINGI